jgi:chitin disaccharide deacetylase
MSSRLLLHADDFGMNRAVSEGILRGFREGLLTSTSLLANAPDAAWALDRWKGLEEERAAGQLGSAAARRRLGDPDCPFDLGVHLNLTQGRPLTGGRYPAELLDREGRFPGVFAVFTRLRRSGGRFRDAMRAELEQQVQFVCDRGLRPTHLNGHQYIEMMPAIATAVLEIVEQFGIRAVRAAWEPSLFRTTVLSGRHIAKWPLACVKRRFGGRFRTLIDARGIAHSDAFFGTAHAGAIDLRLLGLFLAGGRKHRLIEVAVHPGEAAAAISATEEADGWHDPLAAARPGELQMLTSLELIALVESAGWQLARLASR